MKINIYFWLMLIFIFGYLYEVFRRQQAEKASWELVALCKECNNNWDTLYNYALESHNQAKLFKRERDSLINIQKIKP